MLRNKKNSTYSFFRQGKAPSSKFDDDYDIDADIEEEYDAPAADPGEEEWDGFGIDDTEESGKSSFACEDCDYRWEDYYEDGVEDDMEDRFPICPMCGSVAVTQL